MMALGRTSVSRGNPRARAGRRVAASLVGLLLTAGRWGKRQRAAAVFRPETQMATFEVFQREAKPLSDSLKQSLYQVSGQHTTDAPVDINEVPSLPFSLPPSSSPLFHGLVEIA